MPFLFLLIFFITSCTILGDSIAVEKVTDGDSLVLRTGGILMKVRLYGVDCPELHMKKKTKGQPASPKNPAGVAAKNYLESILKTTPIEKLEQVGLDVFNRQLMIIHLKSKTLNEMMLESNHCGFYQRAQSYKDNAFRRKLEELGKSR